MGWRESTSICLNPDVNNVRIWIKDIVDCYDNEREQAAIPGNDFNGSPCRPIFPAGADPCRTDSGKTYNG